MSQILTAPIIILTPKSSLSKLPQAHKLKDYTSTKSFISSKFATLVQWQTINYPPMP